MVPALWAGAASLFSGGWGPGVSCVLDPRGGARRLWRWEVLLEFPDRRGRQSAARAGLFSLSTGQAVNRLCF
ncbi:hypothetical protein GTL34_004832 [Salmonella enterica]|nr:hypothetical protein [Salmonella enterica]